tara:strand:+ start:2288 stop:3154 length:867 start_codon:yes stop_codon:yes gene_type:complete
MEIVFARTRYDYDSYTDFWKLVELAGFKTCYVDEVDFEAPFIYITSPVNGEWRPHRDNHRDEHQNARLIHWSLERPAPVGGWREFAEHTRKDLDDWYFDEVWFSDKGLSESIGDERARFVVLGSHAGLGGSSSTYEHDIIHLSYGTFRRTRVYGDLQKAGLRMAENCWGEARDEALRASKFMLNLHQDDYPVIEPLRFALCAAYAIPMITEKCTDTYPYNRGGDKHYIHEVDYTAIFGELQNCCRESYPFWKPMGRRMFSLMTEEFEFGRVVREAVQTIPERKSADIL